VNVDPSAASLANVSGTATLTGSTVNAVYANGSYVAKQYTILSATGGVKGIFSGLTNTNLPANFTDSLSYDASHAYLDLVLNFTPGQSYGQGLNGNQRNVANALINAFNANGGIPTVFGTLSQAGLTQVSGELATAAQRATFDAMDQFMGTMTDPTVAGWGVCDGPSGTDRSQPGSPSATGCGADHVSVWGAAYGGSRSTNGNPATGSSDTTSDVEGVAAGASYRFSADTVAGVSLGGGGTNFSLANGLGSGRSSLVQAGAFIHHTMGAAYVGGSLAWGWQDFTTTRTVTVAGADQLRARFDANALSGRLESGWRFGAGSVSLTPYAAAQFTSLFLPSYSEQAQAGANTFALDYGSKTATEVRSELGLRVGKSFDVSGGLVTLGGRLAWSHSFNPTPTATAGFQTLPGTAFTVSGASVGSDAALTSVLAGIAWNNGWSLGARFDGAFSAKSRSYDGKVTVSYKW
jgi:uncharacterized protein with beta-barrel porin domain